MVLIGPWLVYNNSGRFKHPVGVTVTLGTLIGSSYCKGTFYGGGIGGWGGLCSDTVPSPWPEDESEAERAARGAGLGYASHHLGRLPIVIPYRLGRSFGFYAPVQMTANDLLLTEAGIHWAAKIAAVQYWVYLAFGIAGGVVLFRRRISLLPLVAPVITVAVITVIGYGTMRFRVALDVVLPVVVGIALDRVLARRRRHPEEANASSVAGTVAANS